MTDEGADQAPLIKRTIFGQQHRRVVNVHVHEERCGRTCLTARAPSDSSSFYAKRTLEHAGRYHPAAITWKVILLRQTCLCVCVRAAYT